ncbi:CBS domain-containing protein [Candidatus Woesearchaeota archaeon]|nr:CBS domain-containing protein [Candidatus Woesearchaeota archaeon]
MAKEKDFREIRSVMNTRVTTLPRDASVFRAAKLMAKKYISCVIITDGRKPAGMITERDMLSRVMAKKLDPEKTTVEEVMSSPVMVVPPESALVPTVELMKKKKIRRFAVVDETGVLIGLVTQTDILQGIVKLVKHLDWKLVTMKISVKDYLEKLKELRVL